MKRSRSPVHISQRKIGETRRNLRVRSSRSLERAWSLVVSLTFFFNFYGRLNAFQVQKAHTVLFFFERSEVLETLKLVPLARIFFK